MKFISLIRTYLQHKQQHSNVKTHTYVTRTYLCTIFWSRSNGSVHQGFQNIFSIQAWNHEFSRVKSQSRSRSRRSNFRDVFHKSDYPHTYLCMYMNTHQKLNATHNLRTIFWANVFLSISDIIMHISVAMLFLKNLAPCRDSNPDLLFLGRKLWPLRPRAI
jgi:hypothetical protein